MNSAKITISFPQKSKVKTASKSLSFDGDKNVYEFVNYVRDNRIDKKIKYSVMGKGRILIRDLVTLHNVEGIQKRNEILSMKLDIKSGEDIFEFENFPNVHLIKNGTEVVVSNGHHTLFAYLGAGKKFLSDVPYILVESSEMKPKEFLVFFGEHKNKMKANDWKKYCVDWNVSESNQLEPRKQETIGEVFDLLGKG
tara:strand:+ start:297 stop:884 length:588 start_codon:yes stop_codon:yes gene_type:complete